MRLNLLSANVAVFVIIIIIIIIIDGQWTGQAMYVMFGVLYML